MKRKKERKKERKKVIKRDFISDLGLNTLCAWVCVKVKKLSLF